MQQYIKDRQSRVAQALNLSNEILLIGSGDLIPVPGGADQCLPFLPHTEYRYIADHDEPGCIVAYDPKSGWVEFRPPVEEPQRVWEGRQPFDWTADLRPTTEFADWLAARAGRPIANLGAAAPGVNSDAALTEAVRLNYFHARRPKDAVEMERVRRAVDATIAGYKRMRDVIRPGVTERQIQVELESEFFRLGGTRTGYGTIVGAGSNAAVLHFTPSHRVVGDDDLVLIDAGAEIDGYTADVTRTYGAKGALTGFRKDLYDAVLSAQKKAVARCGPGVEFRDIHMSAARDLTEGLITLGILKGDADSLVERDAHAIFFPHGLGHLVGLGVRDASGYLPGRERSKRFGLAALRIDLPLQPGYLVTIEPGLYFIPALLKDEARRTQYADCIDWAKVDTLLDIGGVRIEDNIFITPDGYENLTIAIEK